MRRYADMHVGIPACFLLINCMKHSMIIIDRFVLLLKLQ